MGHAGDKAEAPVKAISLFRFCSPAMSLFLVAQYMLTASRYGRIVVPGLVAEFKTEARISFL